MTACYSGITPIYALAREFLMAKRRVTLLGFNHTPQDNLGGEQLQQVQSPRPSCAAADSALQLQQALDGDGQLMRCNTFFTRGCPANRIDAAKVLHSAPAEQGAVVVVCGPAGFLEASR
jgi:ferredoxin-NADP reductase